jgi:hypothetical protein
MCAWRDLKAEIQFGEFFRENSYFEKFPCKIFGIPGITWYFAEFPVHGTSSPA